MKLSSIRILVSVVLMVFAPARAEPKKTPKTSNDSFAAGTKLRKLILGSWERLLVVPEKYENKVISLDGWISVSKNESDELVFKLWSDQESFKLQRVNKSVIVSSKIFIDVLQGKLKADPKLLNGRFVTIWAIFESYNEDAHEGIGVLYEKVVLYINHGDHQGAYENKSVKWRDE